MKSVELIYPGYFIINVIINNKLHRKTITAKTFVDAHRQRSWFISEIIGCDYNAGI